MDWKGPREDKGLPPMTLSWGLLYLHKVMDVNRTYCGNRFPNICKSSHHAVHLKFIQ